MYGCFDDVYASSDVIRMQHIQAAVPGLFEMSIIKGNSTEFGMDCVSGYARYKLMHLRESTRVTLVRSWRFFCPLNDASTTVVASGRWLIRSRDACPIILCHSSAESVRGCRCVLAAAAVWMAWAVRGVCTSKYFRDPDGRMTGIVGLSLLSYRIPAFP